MGPLQVKEKLLNGCEDIARLRRSITRARNGKRDGMRVVCKSSISQSIFSTSHVLRVIDSRDMHRE